MYVISVIIDYFIHFSVTSMIWLSGKGGYVLPLNCIVSRKNSFLCSIQPVGQPATSGISLASHNWTLWKGPNANWEVLSFVSEDGDITDFTADLNDFFSAYSSILRLGPIG